MKILLTLLFISVNANALTTYKVVASENNVPVSFSSAAGSLVVESAPSSSEIIVINESSTALAFAVGKFLSTPESSLTTNPKQGITPASSTGVYTQNVTLGDKVYLRSESAAITSGNIYILFR